MIKLIKDLWRALTISDDEFIAGELTLTPEGRYVTKCSGVDVTDEYTAYLARKAARK